MKIGLLKSVFEIWGVDADEISFEMSLDADSEMSS